MTSQTSRRWAMAVWIAAAAWLALLAVTHADYAVTWDEPEWFTFGETQRQWLARGDLSPQIADPRDFFHYGAVPSLVAAAGQWLTHDVLGWLPQDAAWHVGNFAFAVLLAAGLVTWAWQAIGARGALWAMLLWCAWPRLWPDWHNNISDLPGAAVSIWAAWAAWRTVEDPRDRWTNYLLMGALIGLAYACRAPNVYFLAAWIGAWLLWLRATGRTWPARIYAGVVLAAVVAIFTVKVVSPPFWTRSVLKLVFYYNPQAYLRGTVGQSALWFEGVYYATKVPRYYAPYVFLISTPLAMLALLGGAIVRALRGLSRLPSVVSLWLLLGLGAIGKHLLGAGNYDGVRHFLEGYAPLTLVIAWGVEQWWQAQVARGWRRISIAAAVATALAFVPPLVTAARIHPYQTGYFNALAGTMASAWQRFEFDYWGQGLVEASTWLEREVPGETRVFMPFGNHLMQRTLPARFQVLEISQQQPLSRATPGDLVVLPNREGKNRARQVPFQCPTAWTVVHEVLVRPELPPAVRICRLDSVQ